MAHVARRLARRLGFLAFTVSACLFTACIDLESIAPESKGNDPSATEARVSIDLERDSIAHAVRKQYTAQVKTAFGEIKYVPVTWRSTNPDVVQVTPTGLATAIGAGSAQLIAEIPGDADTLDVSVHGFISTFVVVPEVVEILQGDSIAFEASFGQQGGTASLIQWRTSDTTKAVVDDKGTLAAIDVGDLELTAMYGAKQANAQVRVVPAPVASITIRPDAASLEPGQSVTLDTHLRDAVGRRLFGRLVTWSSSAPAVATVDAQGVVTGKAKGVALITARSEGAEATASVTVSARAVSYVIASLDREELVVGEQTKATALVLDASGSKIPPEEQPVTWQSSNSAIATVDASGVVTALATGAVSIRALSGGKTGSIALTVLAATPHSIVILPAGPTVSQGSQVQLSAEVRDQKGNPISGASVAWASENAAVATISPGGLATAKVSGSTKVTATSGALATSTTLTVTPITVASVSVAPTALTIEVNEDAPLSAVVYDNGGNVLSGRAVTWSSSNTAIASVSAAGVVKGLKSGSAIVTAASEGKTAQSQITVTAPPPAAAPVASISVSLSASALNVGQTAQATAVLYDSEGKVLTGRTVTWSSTAASLATVSSSGLVTAIAPGTVSLIASSEGKMGVATLTVNQPVASPVATVSVSLSPTSVVSKQTSQATVVLKDAQGNALTGRTVGYSSSNTSVAVVSSSGTVTGVATGQATITATSEGKSGSAVLSVTSGIVLVASVELTASVTTLTQGQSTQVKAVTLDAQGNVLTGRDLTWKSSNPGAATVSTDGLVTAVAAGNATITATSGSGAVGSLGFTVKSSTTSSTAAVSTVTVSLGASSLLVGQTTQANALLKDASGNVLSGRTIVWSSSNVSVATVTQAGLVTAVAAGSALISATSEGRTGNTSLSVTAASAPAPSPPPGSETVETLMGPIGTSSAVKALGGIYARYESDFVKYDDAQWATCGPKWDCIDYYDRAMIYYVWWKRTGDPKYRDRATQIALNFRATLESVNYGVVAHWAMMDGIALHYLDTGDPKSLTAVGKVADMFAYLVNADVPGYIGDPKRMDNRIQAYALKTILLAYRLKAPSTGISQLGLPGNNNWATTLRTALNKILATRDADGQWRGAKCGTNSSGQLVRATHPFTVGLLHDGLIRYHELFEADPRIPSAIQQSADVMWQQDWIATSGAFKYVAISCPGEGGPTAAADLNNLIVNGYGWTYRKTGDATWKSRAEAIFSGSVTKDSPSSGPKQFNQSYTSSYRFLNWR